MINGSPSDRRILSFPAVEPCPYIPSSTLLRSLVALAADIASLRSHRRFPVLRRSVREAFREVGVLVQFLEDVRVVPESAVVSFAELHVALQRLRWLLTDCGRRGARLWILMNAERVAAELRVLVRTISTALDVVPLTSVDAGKESKEIVRLLAKQTWEVEIGIDRDDARSLRAVKSILKQFADGASPDAADLRRVLDHLEISNWADCNEEVLFVEDEILDHSDGDKSQAELLGSLMGFLIYCRAVLFDADAAAAARSDRRKGCNQHSRGNNGGGIGFFNPESLRCPVSLELMTDPVTISTGQTYDRASIVRWFKDGLTTCPVTGEKINDTTIVPNSTLQKLIRHYCSLHNIPFAEPSSSSSKKRDLANTERPRCSAAEQATRMTALFLAGKLSAGTKEEKNRAAQEIRLLSKLSIFQRACLVDADCVPWLLHLLNASPDASTQDHVAAALLNLSKHPSGQRAIFEVGGVGLIIDAVTGGIKVEVQQNAAAIIYYLSSVDEYRREIGQFPETVPALINLLKMGTYRGKKNAIVALFGLLLFPGNHPRILAMGVVPILIDLLTDEREDLVNDCVGVLAKLAERREGTKAILRSSPDVLQKLVQVLQSSTSRSGRDYIVSLMLSLCSHGGQKVVSQLENIPLLMPSLYSIAAGGPQQASKKARSLINHIHQMFDQDHHPLPASTPPVHDHAVHAL